MIDNHRARVLSAHAGCSRGQELVNLALLATRIPGMAGALQENSHGIL